MKKIILILIISFFTLSASAEELNEGIYAIIHTSKGDITAKLYFKRVPVTVKNFIGLATGKKSWTHPRSQKYMTTPLYEKMVFHRVIPDFMVQTGDPTGTGMGGPGYKFKDEFHKDLTHNRPGILSMANSGPNTNGSQIFITHKPTPWLDGKHSVFGAVIQGQPVVDMIRKGDELKSVTIKRVGKDAEEF
ncbi:MAG: peptidylprolyl isomerase [SAR324 cluster bacterium]|nr:peptidylprolyl isomerase [SAR324 cluster bacterium]